MGDTKVNYHEQFGINTFKREICAELGEPFWQQMTNGIILPNIETEADCKCCNMRVFMHRFEAMADKATVQKILCRVRHGLNPSQSAWAREEFLKTGNLDVFLKKHLETEMNHFVELNQEHRDFYGQEITDEVLEYIKRNPAMLAPVRIGKKLRCMAFPCNMSEYLKAVDDTMRRYHACHCPFAKESILSGTPVSSTLCNCSLGHVMNFIEAFLECSLQGKVIRSVLNGDLTCEYEIVIPNDIIAKYVTPWETDIVIQNYYQYYRAFTLSGIVELYEEAVDWIMPKEGETGPSLAFHIHLDENRLEGQIQELISGIHAKTIPQRWIITPDATPTNIVSILEEKGFDNLSAEVPDSEPGMLLWSGEFQPYIVPEDIPIICRKVQTRAEFSIWVDVVNTALHGWAMIDAEHYYKWVEMGMAGIYIAEIGGVAVSTAATMRNGQTASLEFVSTLPEYRRQKAAITLCSKALADLFADGVEAVTLSGASEATVLYEKLGFHSCFPNIIMEYKLQD